MIAKANGGEHEFPLLDPIGSYTVETSGGIFVAREMFLRGLVPESQVKIITYDYRFADWFLGRSEEIIPVSHIVCHRLVRFVGCSLDVTNLLGARCGITLNLSELYFLLLLQQESDAEIFSPNCNRGNIFFVRRDDGCLCYVCVFWNPKSREYTMYADHFDCFGPWKEDFYFFTRALF